jgi:hypothetical protein
MTSVDFDNGIGARGFILPTTAAINKKNDQLLKQIADVTSRRPCAAVCRDRRH